MKSKGAPQQSTALDAEKKNTLYGNLLIGKIMLAEIKLQYRVDLDPPQEDYTETVEVSCGTELANLAHTMLRHSHADNVNFSFLEDA